MESSKEKIEAQLCAYIEGELNDAERAEIERHLQTNPQHKALIAELREQRDLLQTLPRATIPGELNENLTGQLERSSLLGDDEETAEAGAGINRWPQFTAIAAVLLLAAGLGTVVYLVLPPANANRGQVAMEDGSHRPMANSPTTRPDVTLSERPAPATTLPLGDAGATTTPGVAFKLAAPAPTGAAGKDVQPSVPLRDLMSGPGLVSPTEVAELQKRMGQTIGGDANKAFHLGPESSLYLVVQAPDPAVANGQVTAFFKSNNIQYMNYEEGGANGARAGAELGNTPLASATGSTGRADSAAAAGSGPGAAIGGGLYGGGFGATRERGSSAGAPGAPSGSAPSGSTSSESQNRPAPTAAPAEQAQVGRGYAQRTQSEARGLGVDAPQAAAAPAEPAKSADKKQVADADAAKEKEVASAGNVERLADRERPAPQSEAKSKADFVAVAGQGGGGGAATTSEDLSLRQKVEVASKPADSTWAMRNAGRVAAIDQLAADTGARGGVIIARMNRRQANELSATLSREQGQRAELREFSTLTGPVVGASVVPAVDSAGRYSRGEPGQAGQATTRPVVVDLTPATPAPASGPAGGGQLSLQTRADGLTLAAQPSDQPVDVVIVVKTAATSAGSASEAAKPADESKK